MTYTYNQALKICKSTPNIVYGYDAGNDNRGRLYYCSQRGRVITQVTRDGIIWF